MSTDLEQWFSVCGSWVSTTSSSSISWEFKRNVHSCAPFQTYWIRNWNETPTICVLTSTPGDSDAQFKFYNQYHGAWIKYKEALRNEIKQSGNRHSKKRAQHVQNLGGCKGWMSTSLEKMYYSHFAVAKWWDEQVIEGLNVGCGARTLSHLWEYVCMPEWTGQVIVLSVALNGPALPTSPTSSHCPSLLFFGSRAIFQFFLRAIFLPPMEGLCTHCFPAWNTLSYPLSFHLSAQADQSKV